MFKLNYPPNLLLIDCCWVRGGVGGHCPDTDIDPCVLYYISLYIAVTKIRRLVQSCLQLVLVNPNIKYPAAYLLS